MQRKDIPPNGGEGPGNAFGGGAEDAFEDIDLGIEEAEPAAASEPSAAAADEDESDVPAELHAARDELTRRLMFDVATEALSAEAGSDAYGPENIVGVGIGEKVSGDEETDDLCVTVYVVAKAPKGQIAPNALVPERINGIPTDVVATGEIVAQPYKGRYRPAPGGVSIGHYKITAGTLGCLTRRGRQLFILSNNHVLANSNNASVGDPIVQPGPIDGGRVPRDVIAKLTKWVPIKFGSGTNLVDCAIAQTTPRLVTPRNIAFGRISPTPAACRVNLLVKKAGRTTQATRGRITDCNATIRVNYGAGVATFTNQIVIRSTSSRPFSQGGDSGSLVMTVTGNRPVGLLFAGSATHTIANPIRRVLTALGVSIVA